ncbi:MAG: DUF2252 domain-containing protein [Candidatus Eremiobacteraeota bacterium]|nr:DUF2252 domain-containing protein [Candidatus Eremiobacteraeota bacterium]
MNPLRKRVPRSTFGSWKPPASRRDTLEIIREDEEGRDPQLLIRRRDLMAADPFAFYRGTAAVMASDLAGVPVTRLLAQIGGDAHVVNFGGYATPERRLVFDVNDFDETLHGPWEWDVARLCASLPLLASFRSFRSSIADDAVFKAVGAYRKAMRRYSLCSPLDIWYASVDVHGSLAKELEPPRTAARVHAGANLLQFTRSAFYQYHHSVLPHVRMLLDRYVPVALWEHPVGVGSLGLYAAIVELQTDSADRLYLQIKEARASALERYLGPSPFASHGERVIAGQRAMQAASDLFLGWTSYAGRDFYVRQLRDEKTTLAVERITEKQFINYARRCGSVLARAHARSGSPQQVAAYLGNRDVFDEAMVRFARTYARVVERDYDAFAKQAHR